MFSLTKSRSEFGIRSSSSADIFSLVFYLVNHNGCCVFYELPGVPFWSGLCPRRVSLFIKHMHKHMHDMHFKMEMRKQSILRDISLAIFT